MAPQGSISSGDCYTYWYEMLLRNMPCMKKCVEDVVGWSESLTQLFHDATNFLSHTSFLGVIQNPHKFVWGHREVEYVGFWLKQDGVRPTEETCAAIR